MSAQLCKQLLHINLKSRCSVPLSLIPNKYYSSSGSLEKVPEKVTQPDEERKEETPTTVTLYGPENVSYVSGIPEEHIKGRYVRIYKTPKNAMQSGTDNTDRWELEFDTRERWENPLMGWSSTGDPVSNIKLQFYDKLSAIKYAEKYNYEYYLEPERKEKPKVKSYGFNFSWNKRTRVSTK